MSLACFLAAHRVLSKKLNKDLGREGLAELEARDIPAHIQGHGSLTRTHWVQGEGPLEDANELGLVGEGRGAEVGLEDAEVFALAAGCDHTFQEGGVDGLRLGRRDEAIRGVARRLVDVLESVVVARAHDEAVVLLLLLEVGLHLGIQSSASDLAYVQVLVAPVLEVIGEAFRSDLVAGLAA